ncbi:Uncharacterized protein Adt_03476 [Abeliophyllum distichum]|uniref:Peptidase A2 domain-containing protein n=1 Tax=Abeliophyllum distichum TaxID=126358 RepID=A0ABD1W0Q6_9LAMI
MTLRKDAREWFDTLPPRSISTFANFAKKFAICFSSSERKKKTTMGLMQVTQDKGETLHEYMSRFNRATLGIKNLQMSSVITALLSGLRNHGFRASLSKKPAESMTELLWQAEEYIDQEEVLRVTRCDQEVYDGGNKKMRREELPTNRKNARNSTDHKYRPRHDFVHAISQIQLNAPLCEFHKDHGHTTDQCRTLRSEVERLVSEGLLKKFLKKNDDRHEKMVEWGGRKRRAGVINIIVGGSAGRGDSRNSRKGYARSLQVNSIGASSKFGRSITFNDDDLEGVSLPHDDALVITGDIANFDVRRVLVDTGSAANVMSWEAFKGVKIPTDRLRSMNTPLQGFGGGTVIPEGIVDLPVVLGQHPYSVTLITPFLIVRTPMAYNSIYGRPIINSAGAIISTQHQCMKFPTGRGIGIISGDQLNSRRCYVDSIRHETDPTVLMIEKNEFPQAQRFELAEEVETVEVAEGKKVAIGRSLSDAERANLFNMLQENIEVFAWGTDDLPSVDPSIAQCRLNNKASFKPVKQRKRQFSPERQQAIKEEL